MLLFNDVTEGKIKVEAVNIGVSGKTTLPNYLSQFVIVLPYIKHIEK